jgi:hypothetical protein
MASSIVVTLTNPIIPTGSKTFTFSMSDQHFTQMIDAHVAKYTNQSQTPPTQGQAATQMVKTWIDSLKSLTRQHERRVAAEDAASEVPPIDIVES